MKRVTFIASLDMPERTDWEAKAANLLKAELKREGVTYADLAARIGDKEVNIRNKLSRGKFSAAFLLEALCAINVTRVEIR